MKFKIEIPFEFKFLIKPVWTFGFWDSGYLNWNQNE
jgi:hypothetical protein